MQFQSELVQPFFQGFEARSASASCSNPITKVIRIPHHDALSLDSDVSATD